MACWKVGRFVHRMVRGKFGRNRNRSGLATDRHCAGSFVP
jgi:hypothetical protein